MPAAVAIPLITAGVTGATSIVGAKMQSGAAKDAAQLSTDAANHGADLQAQSNREALQFQREQAQIAAEQAEIDKHANYDQAQARMQRLGSIGALLGIKDFNTALPAYVPGVVPHYTTGTPPPSVGSALTGPPAPSRVPGVLPFLPPLDLTRNPDGTVSLPAPRYGSVGSYLGA